MSICCNCNKEAMLLPCVCSDCLSTLKGYENEIKRLKEIIDKASQLLQDKGFEEESKSIDCMAEL